MERETGKPPKDTFDWRRGLDEAGQDTLFIRPAGEASLDNTIQLKKFVVESLSVDENLTHIRLDLSRCDFVDGTFLGVIVGMVKRIRERPGGLVDLVIDDHNINKIFEITGLDKVFPIMSTVGMKPAAETEWQEVTQELMEALQLRRLMIQLGHLAQQIDDGSLEKKLQSEWDERAVPLVSALKSKASDEVGEGHDADRNKKSSWHVTEKVQPKRPIRKSKIESFTGKDQATLTIRNGAEILAEKTSELFESLLEDPSVQAITLHFDPPSLIERGYTNQLLTEIGRARQAGKTMVVTYEAKPRDVIPLVYERLQLATGQLEPQE